MVPERVRRSVLLAATVVLAAACHPGTVGTVSPRVTRGAATPTTYVGDPAHPNFVLVLTDDQRWDTIGRCVGTFDANDLSGGDAACMPKVNADLTAQGVTFRRGYDTTALCCPSRSSILTGRYARHTGVLSNSGGYAKFDESSTIATWLHAAGYRTGLIGKYMNEYGTPPTPDGHVPPGWDVWHAFWENGIGEDSNLYTKYQMLDAAPGAPATLNSYAFDRHGPKAACADNNLYSTDLVCLRALQFLDQSDPRPFFLYVAPRSPHMNAIAPTRWKGFANTVSLPTYPNFNVAPSPNPPKWVPANPLSADRMATLAAQFRSILATNRAVDDAVGALHDHLAADGRLANTVWVFLSDNGFARGEHRWATKQCIYEECQRVPFVVVCPRAICPGATPGTVDATDPVLNIDLAPTLAALAGVTPPSTVDGVSLVGVLNHTQTKPRGGFVLEDFERLTDRPTGFVDTWPDDGHDYKYVELSAGGVREYELYDLTADPWELANLAGDPAHAAVQAWLAAGLRTALGK